MTAVGFFSLGFRLRIPQLEVVVVGRLTQKPNCSDIRMLLLSRNLWSCDLISSWMTLLKDERRLMEHKLVGLLRLQDSFGIGEII